VQNNGFNGINSFKLKSISKQILLITLISGIASGIFYLFRTNYLDLSPLGNNIFRAIRMTIFYVILPFGWAYYYKHLNKSDLGITKKRLFASIILGLGVYTIALFAFLLSLGNPAFDHHFSWGMDYSLTDWLLTMSLVSWMAFVNDLWTRGFVLMLLAKFQTPWFAIIAQNITWLMIHLYEVAILSPSMGLLGALGLTVVLGVCGDLVALKTRNIIGLGIGHIYLNIAFFSYVRFLG